MKKFFLTIVSACLLIAAYGQQQGKGNSIRQRLTELNMVSDENELDKKLTELVSGANEEDYLLAYYYYANKDLTDKAEITKQLIQRKFPDGQLVMQGKMQEIDELTDLKEKDKRFIALFEKNPNGNYAFLAYSLAQEFAAKGNEEKMKFYADIYAKGATDGKGNSVKKENIYAMMAGGMVQTNPDAAARYLKVGVEDAKISLDNMLAEANPDENVLMRAKSNYYGVLSSYVHALSLGSNPEEGYRLAHKSYSELQSAEATDARLFQYVKAGYIQALIRTKRFKEALPLMEEAIKAGNASDLVKNELKNAYIAVNGSDNDFLVYERDLLNAQQLFLEAEVSKIAIKQPAHDFELKDVDGKSVKLSDLRGKVVVLDFWATWCGPCKASFPAMQKAVNKYKDDQDVKFLFLHTWEKGGGDPTQNAKKYVVDNNYTFDVLMDLRNPETKNSAVASSYQVQGIPTKIIIDPKGQIRFNTSGFSADADKAVKELSVMIEFAKKG
ncbi:redoxin domain-containing protein [Sphingobacterium alkalisoli]|uniref:Redoxin domain-containing protein n=1 Tax=Sphingobacterium alkalisoli TaxID=1874115 RepID=A0A4U0H964_9SPHI|nr:redoxin domain-containing protein [Sphingobacterium alkalisoli]TJY68417.1 redoxin domain-containing protein [Sphingobacterium alkalisoli]GGH06644.1 hypothetical protein GCM10011418_03450 [Sphingobacterium alkalisoli]